MSCPSVFELRHFVGAGEASVELEEHVSRCERCGGTLARLARQALRARGLIDEVALPSRAATVPAFVALAACLAVALVHPVKAQRVVSYPEGEHGVPVEVVEPGIAPVGVGDAGAVDSGM